MATTTSAERWGVLKDMISALAALLAACAAIFASCQAEDYVAWLKARRSEHFTAGADWKVAIGSQRDWRTPAFDDHGWSER